TEDYCLRGDLLWSLGKLDQAVSNFLLAHQLRPNKVKPILRLCQIYSAKKAILLSVVFADKLLALDGQAPESLSVCAMAFGQAEQFETALKVTRRLVSLDPNNPLSHAFLGLAQRYTKDEKAALVSMEKAISLAPGDPQFISIVLADLLATGFDAKVRN